MKSYLIKSVLFAAMCLGACSSTLASPFIANFSIAGFEDGSPLQSITGNITWEASSLAGPIDHITSVNLSILGHTYAVDQIHAISNNSLPGAPPWNTITISGLLNDNDAYSAAIGIDTDDFWLRWHSDTNQWEDFVFASSSVTGIWSADHWHAPAVTQFDISPVAVPEPAAWTLLLVTLLLLGGQRTLRNRSK